MSTALGRQAAATLHIGDRYMYEVRGESAREVTVSSVYDNVDGSFNVRHQRSDVKWGARYVSSDAVHVTHRSPRCPHGSGWDECGRCGDVEWPPAIEAAYFGEA
ncbi:hypothetical protein ABT224_36165 [Streptomyces sp. NPDC001584]|uniref:hypothetical protein n=1 Tax=Streptomyces sp. NPDC001584 TaxID=3154521 RepID=UPI0033274E3B